MASLTASQAEAGTVTVSPSVTISRPQVIVSTIIVIRSATSWKRTSCCQSSGSIAATDSLIRSSRVFLSGWWNKA